MAIDNRELREQLVELIRGGSAHADVKSALADFPAEKRAIKPDGTPYNAWQLLWHMQFTLHDLLEFCTDAKYLTPKWPDDYWPKEEQPASSDAWAAAVRGLEADLAEFETMIMNPAVNLYSTIPWETGRPYCARFCWQLTTTAIISVSLCCCASSLMRGRVRLFCYFVVGPPWVPVNSFVLCRLSQMWANL